MHVDRRERPITFRDLSSLLSPARAWMVVLLAGSASAQWPQFGGEHRDFHASTTGLAEKWPEAGPKKAWERKLGAGYSSVVADGDLVFTMYRSGADEVVVALYAKTGTSAWEHRIASPGDNAPNSTPTIAGDRLYALDFAGVLCALDKKSGKLAWSHDLVREYAAKRPQYGFSSSPLAYGESLIVPVGGTDYGVAAFALADGKLLWHAHDLREFYASPILIEVGGEAQIVVLAQEHVVGLKPETGEMLWDEPIPGEQNIATPVWGSDGLLCVTAGAEGSVGLKLSKKDGKTHVERAWKNELQISQTTVVRVGDHLYGSTGDPACVTAIDARTGAVAWREPGFSVANLVAGDGKLVLFDYEGVVALGTAGPDGFRVSSRASLMNAHAFTPPSLAGKCLYLRDQEKIVALDLRSPN